MAFTYLLVGNVLCNCLDEADRKSFALPHNTHDRRQMRILCLFYRYFKEGCSEELAPMSCSARDIKHTKLKNINDQFAIVGTLIA